MTCHALPCLDLSYCVRRAIRKLVTNNKRRHSLILALHAAGSGNGYGDLGNVYDAVKGMHDGLAAGTGWNTEAGALCLKWATYVRQAHSPPTWRAERLVQNFLASSSLHETYHRRWHLLSAHKVQVCLC
jgi:hypothetical protein